MFLKESFEQFQKTKVNLDDTRMKRVKSAHHSVRGKLGSIEAVREILTGFYLQGSYALLTACRPCDDAIEYDVDIVMAADFRNAHGYMRSGQDVLAWLQEQIESIGLYKGKTTILKCCVRIAYESDGQRFHLDVVPAHRPDTTKGSILIAPKWSESDPRGYQAWFAKCQKRCDRLRHVVRLLKYWRNVQGGGPNSMILTTLAAQHVPTSSRSLDDALVKTMTSLNGWLREQTAYGVEVLNPSLKEENLARNWTGAEVTDFQRLFSAATAKAKEARSCKDEEETISLWNDPVLFDGRFPKTVRGLGNEAKAAAAAIGDGLGLTAAGQVCIGRGPTPRPVKQSGGFYGARE
jgi:hypothetical protein